MSGTTITYKATSLADIANHCDEAAESCERRASRRRLRRDQWEDTGAARAYRLVADTLRKTTIVSADAVEMRYTDLFPPVDAGFWRAP